jgi:hypothetical protein
MCSDVGDTTQLVPGFPIRTPWDHSSVDSSPRPIAASHVLHRLLVPRHPPCALSNLTTKMLASTVQFSTNTHPHPPRHSHHPTPGARPATRMQMPPRRPKPPEPLARLVPSGPNRMLDRPTSPPAGHAPHPPQREAVRAPQQTRPVRRSPVSPPSSTPTPTSGRHRGLLHRSCSLERR